ncbi:MAG TPA: glycosyltransferase [Bryobacteraceae bacterium]|nr:glycosyltransferase [Bryobacteraceae bacterium]
MPEPRVSVILPAYNVAPFVRAAADSVLSQSWTDLELIAIDDGSSDTTAQELEQIRDARLRLLRRQHQGAAAARNAGLGAARGRYVAFMDGDDRWLEDKLERDIACLDGLPEADLVFSAMRMVDESGRDLGRTIRRWQGVLTLRDLLIENMIGSDTVVMRREVVDRVGCFDEQLPAGSDYDYWLRVALVRPGNLLGSARVSALYRRRPGQLTGNWEQQLEVWQRIMTKMRRACPGAMDEVEHLAGAGFHRAQAAAAYEQGDTQSAARLFRQAVRRAPTFLLKDRRTWLLGAALASAQLLPPAVHHRLEGLVRTARASRP